MARYLLHAPSAQAASPATSLQLNYRLTVYGSDVQGGTLESSFSVEILYSDSGAQAVTKINDAVAAKMAALGLTNDGGYRVSVVKV